jgi:hypothetical protein
LEWNAAFEKLHGRYPQKDDALKDEGARQSWEERRQIRIILVCLVLLLLRLPPCLPFCLPSARSSKGRDKTLPCRSLVPTKSTPPPPTTTTYLGSPP